MAISESSSTNDPISSSQTSQKTDEKNKEITENKSAENDIDINLNLTENDDSWLKEEDEKNMKEIITENKTENDGKLEVENIGKLEDKKIEDFDAQKTNLQSDMEIINGLNENKEIFPNNKSENNLELENKKIDEKSSPKDITDTKAENKSNTINLDNFLGQIKNTNQITNEINNNVVTNNSQNYNKQNDITIKKGSPNKTLIFILMFLLLIGLGFFIIKTMFPVELQNLFGTGKTNIENLTGDDLSDNEFSGDILSGNILTGNELTGNTISGDIHNSANLPGINNENTFQDIDGLIDNTDPITSLSQLKDFGDKGNKFWTLGKTTNDKLLIKYGLYIRKKSDQLIERLESGENIDKKDLDKYITQFSGYLEKLNNLNTIPTTTENEIPKTPTESGGQTTDRQQNGTDQQIESEQIDQIQDLPPTQ